MVDVVGLPIGAEVAIIGYLWCSIWSVLSLSSSRCLIDGSASLTIKSQYVCDGGFWKMF